jgi:hypothetical protein
MQTFWNYFPFRDKENLPHKTFGGGFTVLETTVAPLGVILFRIRSTDLNWAFRASKGRISYSGRSDFPQKKIPWSLILHEGIRSREISDPLGCGSLYSRTAFSEVFFNLSILHDIFSLFRMYMSMFLHFKPKYCKYHFD